MLTRLIPRFALILPLARGAAGQAQFAEQHPQVLAGFLDERPRGAPALPATRLLAHEEAGVEPGGETPAPRHTDAHFAGDAWVWLPQRGIFFTGDLAQARRESGDYEDFLANVVGRAAQDMEPITEVLDRHTDLPQFRHRQNYADLHRANMSRAFTEFEAAP